MSTVNIVTVVAKQHTMGNTCWLYLQLVLPST